MSTCNNCGKIKKYGNDEQIKSDIIRSLQPVFAKYKNDVGINTFKALIRDALYSLK